MTPACGVMEDDFPPCYKPLPASGGPHMLSISRADCAEDFEIVARLGDAFGKWDAQEVQAYGVPPELVLGLFHSNTSASLAAEFSGGDAKIFVAR